VGREVLVLHVDARDPRRALERRALTVDGQLRADLGKLPLERSGQVRNLEVNPGMDGVEVQVPAGAIVRVVVLMGFSPLFVAWCTIEYANNSTIIP
jgi:hypothetical protein